MARQYGHFTILVVDRNASLLTEVAPRAIRGNKYLSDRSGILALCSCDSVRSASHNLYSATNAAASVRRGNCH
jgi:hypothetical protein